MKDVILIFFKLVLHTGLTLILKTIIKSFNVQYTSYVYELFQESEILFLRHIILVNGFLQSKIHDIQLNYNYHEGHLFNYFSIKLA